MRPQDRIRKQLRGYRLDDVFAYPGAHQVAIEPDVVMITDRDYCDTGLAELYNLMQTRSRHLDAADVDDDGFRRPCGAKISNRAGNTAAPDGGVGKREMR